MQKKKQRNLIISILLALVLTTGIFMLIPKVKTANAATIVANDKLNYTLTTNADGESTYKVAVKPAYRSQVEFIVVPEMYEGIPVTNGFWQLLFAKL